MNVGGLFTLDPMPSNERRVSHVVLSRKSHLTTESTGVGCPSGPCPGAGGQPTAEPVR